MTLEEQIASLQAENTELESHIHAGVKEITRLNAENRMLREGSALIVRALDAAMQLTEALIMFSPEGQPLAPLLGEAKASLDKALTAIGVRK